MHSERIDQLRGFAAIAVVLCHLAVSAWNGAPNEGPPPLPLLRDILGYGYLGVPLFFVISGFCIHLPQARTIAARGDVQADWGLFFRRRFWRLYPPYLASLAIAVVLALLATGTIPVPWPAVAAQALLVHTLHPASFDGVNPPAWTLAVEAQLYLAYPLVLAAFRRMPPWRALGLFAGITMAWRVGLNFLDLPRDWGGLFWEVFVARWFEWVLGAFLAAWAMGSAAIPRVLRHPATALACFSGGVFLEWHSWHHGLYALKEPLYGVSFAILVAWLLGGERGAGGARAPGRIGRWLAGVGVFSYSLYLLHRPMQLAFEPAARWLAVQPSVVRAGIPTSLILMTAITPLVMAAARLFYRFVEAPSIARSRRVGAPPATASGPRDAVTAR